MTGNSNDPLRTLNRDVTPPDSLKQRVLGSLWERGLLSRARPFRKTLDAPHHLLFHDEVRWLEHGCPEQPSAVGRSFRAA